MLLEQQLATIFDIDANSHTLRTCVRSFTTVTNLSHRLQSRKNGVQWLIAQLSLFQQMYQDARQNIS
ncbi:hypothetical protein ACSBR1_015706 [Camellia fascicularis]